MIFSSEKRFFTSNLLVSGNWTSDRRATRKRGGRRLEHLRAKVRARVEHPFRVIKQQFGFQKTRYRGLAKNGAQLNMPFALTNLWMARRRMLSSTGQERL